MTKEPKNYSGLSKKEKDKIHTECCEKVNDEQAKIIDEFDKKN